MSSLEEKLDEAERLLKAAKRSRRIRPYISGAPKGAERRMYRGYLSRALNAIQMARMVMMISDSYESDS